MFASAIGKMRKKLASWKSSVLSIARRIVLTQTSIATILTYTISMLALSVSVCDNIDRICINFLWGHDVESKKKFTSLTGMAFVSHGP